MDTKEHIIYLKEFKKFAKEINKTKESSKDFLIRAGILTRDGKLTKHYILTEELSKSK
jgi:hypothetical protein